MIYGPFWRLCANAEIRPLPIVRLFLSWQELDGKDLGADAPLSVSWLFCSAAHGQGMTAQQGYPTICHMKGSCKPITA